jgi:uncharacterized protein YdaU (DUF1376 family)
MNYYYHHIGDYRRDTAHLSLLEHGIYRQLLDQYHLNEGPICADNAKLMRSLCVRNADEMRALENVLTDFFTKTENGYIHHKCEGKIKEFQAKSDRARESANARWHRGEEQNNANGMRSHSEGNTNHKPITNNHKPIIKKENNKKKKQTTSDEVDFYDVPEKIIKDFKIFRKEKNAAITQTAIDKIKYEANKAGIGLADALTICCTRGWTGFNSEWFKSRSHNARASPAKLEKFDPTTYVNQPQKAPKNEHEITFDSHGEPVW